MTGLWPGVTLTAVTYPPDPANSGYAPQHPGHQHAEQPFQLGQMALPPRRRLWPWLLAAGLLALALAVGGILWAVRPTTDPMQARYDACAAAVTERLKAPSTAKFGGWSFHDDTVPAEVHGWVDSENSFGAMIRTGFECSVRVDPLEVLHVTFDEP